MQYPVLFHPVVVVCHPTCIGLIMSRYLHTYRPDVTLWEFSEDWAQSCLNCSYPIMGTP